MILSNFKFEKMEGNSALNKVYYASVDVETGMLWWKKKKREKIQRQFASYWFFVSTGQWTPGWEAEHLAKSWTAQTGDET